MDKGVPEIDFEKYIMYRDYYRILEQWITNIHNEKKVKTYFQYYNYKKIAIYGFGKLAKHLIYELKDSDIVIEYIVDKKKVETDIAVYSDTEKEYPNVDVLIVTPVYAFKEIEKKMSTCIDTSIVSLQEVINEVADI